MPLKSIRRWFGSTHTASQILVNREIHFHTKSASIREALKGARVVMILSHAYYFLTFSNMVLSKYAASQRRLSSDRNKLSQPLFLTEPNQLDCRLSSFHGREHQTIQEGKRSILQIK